MEQVNIKQYTILEKIGEGGMSNVFLAFDNQLKHKVAIKKLKSEFIHSPNLKNRFIAEVKNMFRMNHPNVVKVYGLIEDGDFIGAVMEYLPGVTLSQHISTHGVPDNNQIKDFLTKIIDALKYVHDEGFIHRDIKPSNFIIDNNLNIKLLDFGIAKNLNSEISDYTTTGTIQQIGTPLYMSPEQISTPMSISQSTDIYSLGLVIYFLVNGKSPYDEDSCTLFELQMKIVTEELVFKNSSPWNFIVKKATQKKVHNRYADINELEKDVKFINVLEDKTIIDENKNLLSFNSAKELPKARIGVNKKRKIKWLIGAVILAIITAIVVITYETDTEKIASSENIVKAFVNDLDLDIRSEKAYPRIKKIDGPLYYIKEFKIENTTIESDESIVVFGTFSKWNKKDNVKFIVKKIDGKYQIINSLGLSAYNDSPLMRYCIRNGYFKNKESKETDYKINEICKKHEFEFNLAVALMINEIEEKVVMVNDESNITSEFGYYASGYVTIRNGTLIDLPMGAVKFTLSVLNSNFKEIYTQPINIYSNLDSFDKVKANIFISDLPASNFRYKVKVEVNSKELIENAVADNL
jgi:tRNA A-37 threonylcarbamoyl transferase component Bud32